MRGSNVRIASRMARVRSVMSIDYAVLPDSAGMPKFRTDLRTNGALASGLTASSCVALNSHARSRSTDSRSLRFDSTRASRGSTFLSGSSSVRRSRSAGCRRSCGTVVSAMVLARRRAVVVAGRSEHDRSDVHQRDLFPVGREDALTEAAEGVRRDLLPHGLAGERDQAVG